MLAYPIHCLVQVRRVVMRIFRVERERVVRPLHQCPLLARLHKEGQELRPLGRMLR